MLEQVPQPPIETIIKHDVWFYILSRFSSQEICVLALVGRIWKQESAKYIHKQLQAIIGKGLVHEHLAELSKHQFQHYFSKILKAEQLFEITVEEKTFHVADFYDDEHRHYFADPKNETSISRADTLACFVDSLESALMGSSFTEKLYNQELSYQLRFTLVGLYQNVESYLAMMMLGVQMAHLWKIAANQNSDPELNLSFFIACPLTTQLISRDFKRLNYYLFKVSKRSLLLTLLKAALGYEQTLVRLELEKIISRIDTETVVEWSYSIEKKENEYEDLKLFLFEVARLETEHEFLIDKIFPLFGILLVVDFPTAKDLPVIKKRMTPERLRNCLDVIEYYLQSDEFVPFFNLITKEFQPLISSPVLIRIFSLVSSALNIKEYSAFANKLLDEFDKQINDRVLNAIIRFLPNVRVVNVQEYRKFVDSVAKRCTSLDQNSIAIIFNHIHSSISEAEYSALITFYLDKSSTAIQAAILRRIFSAHTNMPEMTIRKYWSFLNSLVARYLPAFIAAGSHVVVDMLNKKSPLLSSNKNTKWTLQDFEKFKCFYQILLEIKPKNNAEEDDRNKSVNKIDNILWMVFLEQPTLYLTIINYRLDLIKQLSLSDVQIYRLLYSMPEDLSSHDYKTIFIRFVEHLECSTLEQILKKMPQLITADDYCEVSRKWINKMEVIKIRHSGIKFTFLEKMPKNLSSADYAAVVSALLRADLGNLHEEELEQILSKMPENITCDDYLTVVNAMSTKLCYLIKQKHKDAIIAKKPKDIDTKLLPAFLSDPDPNPSKFESVFRPVGSHSPKSKSISTPLPESILNPIVLETIPQDFVEEQTLSFDGATQIIFQDTDSPVPTETESSLSNEPANETQNQPIEIDNHVPDQPPLEISENLWEKGDSVPDGLLNQVTEISPSEPAHENRSLNPDPSKKSLLDESSSSNSPPLKKGAAVSVQTEGEGDFWILKRRYQRLQQFFCFSTQFILAAILFSVGLLISAFWATSVNADVFGGLLISSIVSPIIGICAQCVISYYDYQQWKVNHRDGSSFLGDQLRSYLPKTFAGRVCCILGFYAFLALIGVSIAFFLGNADCVQFLSPLFDTVHHFLTAGLSLFGSNLAIGVQATNIFSAFFLCVMPLLVLEIGRRTPLFYQSSRDPLNEKQDHLDHQHSNLNELEMLKGQGGSSLTLVTEPIPTFQVRNDTYNVEQGFKFNPN